MYEWIALDAAILGCGRPSERIIRILYQLKDRYTFDPPSLTTAAKFLFSLAQVDRWFHRAIIWERQGLFLQLASSWPAELTLLPSALTQPFDWRECLLKFIRTDDPHVLNRWRFHKMAVQIARGYTWRICGGNSFCTWSAGELTVPCSLERSGPMHWEERAVEH